ncbi:di-heme-cytochrome C peroxidase [Sphingomonas sp.]|uniref:di-heme-cytochrome C peroxidase n=1 Tax=Sphingomonas sp. TaxID=28214 RepID=UPI003D6C8131
MRSTRSFGKLTLAASVATSLILSGTVLASGAVGQDTPVASAASGVIFLDQGSAWTDAARRDFYSRDQGSQMIPYAWLAALTTADGQPFLGDQFARYGYLPNPGADLPVGFTKAGPAGQEMAGMTCAACHTRQISVGTQQYRVDGGPALVDFQALLSDMLDAVDRVRATDATFATFAAEVLGANAPKKKVTQLRKDVDLWYLRENALRTGAYPTPLWGVGRLDAVSMIFDRLAGLDLGKPPSYLIPGNIKLADAPVRYPFLWNAPKQDYTQWPGFAANGSDIYGLARNTGEVVGVFGKFRPRKSFFHLFGIDFLNRGTPNATSVQFDGLLKLEDLVKQIGAPKWPFAIDQGLAARGQAIFNLPDNQGGCVSCHGVTPGVKRIPGQSTWATPLLDVGTDTRQYDILARESDPGVLKGAHIPFLTKPIPNPATTFSLLGVAVGGAILQSGSWVPAIWRDRGAKANLSLSSEVSPEVQAPMPSNDVKQALDDSFNDAAAAPADGKHRYESRVLFGIWATAPYLHNGSVATLADLLRPASQRAALFKVGAAYDTQAVGLAAVQPGLNSDRVTTGCDNLNSGNSRCGHEFGTTLSDADKRALLEYLKML